MSTPLAQVILFPDRKRFERGNVLTAHEFRVQVGIAAFHLFRAHDIW